MLDEAAHKANAVTELQGLLAEFPDYRRKVNIAIETYETYNLPNKYELLLELLAKQEAAIGELLRNHRLPYQVSELMLNKKNILHEPHLKNMAHIASAANEHGLSKEEKEELVQSMCQVLHEFKEGTAAADILPARVVPAINRYISSFPEQEAERQLSTASTPSFSPL